MALAYKEMMDTMELMRKRLQLLVGATIKQRDKIARAIELQDNLYAKHSNISKDWDGTDEIRKWREQRK